MPKLMQLGVLYTQLRVMATQLNVTDDCYVTGQTLKPAIVCDQKVVLASPMIALYEKGALQIHAQMNVMNDGLA